MSTVVNKEGAFAYSTGKQENIRTNALSNLSSSGKPAEAPGVSSTTPVLKSGGEEIAKWGEDNFFPQKVTVDVESNKC